MNKKAGREDKPPLLAIHLITFLELCKMLWVFLKYEIFRLCYERHIYQKTALHI